MKIEDPVILVPIQGIRVSRNGKTVTAPIGEAFEFTQEEAKEVLALNPAAVRQPKNEVEVDAPAAGKKGGKKTAVETVVTENNDDDNSGDPVDL